MEWLDSLTLAVIQGLTEFLPVSSSGHLAVAEAAFRHVRAAPDGGGLFFAVMLHLGTLLAIVAFYRREAWDGAVRLASSGRGGDGSGRWPIIRSGLLAGLATLPAVAVGLGLKSVVEAAFASPLVPAFGFLVTAAVLLLSGRLPDGGKGPAETTWRDALLIGLAQAVAITPGISRSGSTIAAALALGLSRTWAVGFSLLMAVPAILGATVLELKDLDGRSLAPGDLLITLAATALAGLVGYGAIVWLVRIVRSGRLWYFSVYLVLLSAAVFAGVGMSGRGSDAGGMADGQGRRSEALDRPDGVGLDRSGPGGAGAADDLDHADPAGPGSPGATARSGEPGGGTIGR